MAKEKVHIVACLDKKFVMPTGVMMCSACVNNPDVEIVFHLIGDESLSDHDKQGLADVVSLYQGKETVFYEIDSQLSRKYPCRSGNITQATYYRLFLTKILPESLDKVLYIDGDCIIRHSLFPLWNTDISEYAIGVCPDSLEAGMDIYDRLRYSSSKGYFNAGVMLINLNYWRIHNLAEQFTDYLERFPNRILFEDQDLMNVIFQDSKLVLPIKYNFQAGFLWNNRYWDYKKYEEEFKEGLKDPVIVHFSTDDKPWHIYSYGHHPYKSTFKKYQLMTKWQNVRYEHRPWNIILKDFIGDILREIKVKEPLSPRYINTAPID